MTRGELHGSGFTLSQLGIFVSVSGSGVIGTSFS